MNFTDSAAIARIMDRWLDEPESVGHDRDCLGGDFCTCAEIAQLIEAEAADAANDRIWEEGGRP